MFLVQCIDSISGQLQESLLFPQLNDAIEVARRHIRKMLKSHVNIYEVYIGSPFDFNNMGPPLHTIRP